MQSAARLCSLTVGLSLGIFSLGLNISFRMSPVQAAELIAAEYSTGGATVPPRPLKRVENAFLKATDRRAYTQAMLVGYAAAEQGDYHTALINFRRALAERPGDRYALAAIDNMQTYITREREEARKRAEIARLQDVLSRAVQSNDWACAATSVDRLVQLVPPDSVDRDRLIAYRGEIGGLIESRANLDQWSTICMGGAPE